MNAGPTTDDRAACANPSCSTPAEWRVTLFPDDLMSGPTWLRGQPLLLCSSDVELIKAWGSAVGMDQQSLQAEK